MLVGARFVRGIKQHPWSCFLKSPRRLMPACVRRVRSAQPTPSVLLSYVPDGHYTWACVLRQVSSRRLGVALLSPRRIMLVGVRVVRRSQPQHWPLASQVPDGSCSWARVLCEVSSIILDSACLSPRRILLVDVRVVRSSTQNPWPCFLASPTANSRVRECCAT